MAEKPKENDVKVTPVYKPEGMKKVPVREMPEKMKSMCCMDEGGVPYHLPSVYLNDKQVSEIKGWKVGSKYVLTIEVEMKGMRENKETTSADFEIVAYKVAKNDKK